MARKLRITGKQKSARRKNIAIARKKKKKKLSSKEKSRRAKISASMKKQWNEAYGRSESEF